MRNVLKITLVAAAMLLGTSTSWATPVFTGPISPYYLDGINNKTIYVVQGTSVINSFPWAYGTPCSNFCEGNLAVTNVVSTTWAGSDFGSPGNAGQYTLSGTPTGTQWTDTPLRQFFDGTSDGTRNYAVDIESNTLFATDLNWQNPVALFGGDAIASVEGITYDPNNNSLWMSIGTTVGDYSLTGTLLSSFLANDVANPIAALAFNPADGTLWLTSQQFGSELFQYSTSGTLLQEGTPTGLPDDNYIAGEFAEGTAAVPEPATLLLLGTGLFGLSLMRWRRAA